MKILAIDTSSERGSIALLEDDQVSVEFSQKLERQYSSNLVPMIEQVLAKASVKLSEIEGYAVGVGPGSFTGIRVGITTVKGLALVTKKPVVGISSLLALAYNTSGGSYAVTPLVDAKRNLVYFAWYRPDQNGKLSEQIPPTLGTIHEALSKINRVSLFIGDAVLKYRRNILSSKREKAHFTDFSDPFPRAVFIGKIALEKFQKGKTDSINSLAPTYLYSRYCSIGGNR